MTEFDKLVICNFLGYGPEQVVSLSNQGLVKIEADNGYGKSAIIEALVWCLWGKTIRKVSANEVVNNKVRKDCYVSIYFRVNSIPYRISRYRKHRKHHNRVRVWVKDKQISFRHESETQSLIEHVLGVDFTSFTSSVIFGQLKPFSLMKDAEQKKVLESFLRFGEFDKALKRTKELLSEAIKAESDKRVVIERLRGEAAAVKESIGTLEALGKEREQDLEHKLKKLSRKLKDNSEDGEALEKLSKKEKQFQSLLQAVALKIGKSKQERDSTLRTLESLEDDIKAKAEMVGHPCPTCGATMTEDRALHLLKHRKKEFRSAKSSLAATRETLSHLRKEEEYARKGLKRVTEKKYRLEQNTLAYGERRERVHTLWVELNEVRSLRSVSRLSKLYLKYSRKKTELLRAERSLFKLRENIERLRFWEVGFGNKGIKSMIVREALPSLNSKLREYVDIMFHGTVEMELVPSKTTDSGDEREFFHVQYISNAGDGTRSYAGESTGRRKRADICILLCFAWLSNVCNILMIDELLDGLDEEGRADALNLLSTLRGSVFVITHRKEIKSDVGQTWHIVKERGFSKVEAA